MGREKGQGQNPGGSPCLRVERGRGARGRDEEKEGGRWDTRHTYGDKSGFRFPLCVSIRRCGRCGGEGEETGVPLLERIDRTSIYGAGGPNGGGQGLM